MAAKPCQNFWQQRQSLLVHLSVPCGVSWQRSAEKGWLSCVPEEKSFWGERCVLDNLSITSKRGVNGYTTSSPWYPSASSTTIVLSIGAVGMLWPGSMWHKWSLGTKIAILENSHKESTMEGSSWRSSFVLHWPYHGNRASAKVIYM